MIAKGFENTATKQELRDLQTNIDNQFSGVHERLSVVEVKLDRALYTEISHLESRVKRL